MREIFKKIKKHFVLLLGCFVLLLGTGLFFNGLFNFSSHGLFNFSSHCYSEKTVPGGGIPGGGLTGGLVATDSSHFYPTAGAVLIVFGLLLLKTGRKERQK